MPNRTGRDLTAESFAYGLGNERVFLRLFPPEQLTRPTTPRRYFRVDISVMQPSSHWNKSQQAWRLGPSAEKQFFDYGPYDDWRRRCKGMTLLFDFSSN
jgi:hypothetical protein